MGRIVISTNTTIDGISQDPTGEEGFEFGGWLTRITHADRAAWAKAAFDEVLDISAILLGGRSYEWFAQRWVGRPGEWADRFNALPKYVVRTTGDRSDWGPTTVLSGDIAAEIGRLKDSIDGDIAVYASYQLVRTLMELDLVDEVRLVLFPQVVGSGGRVFTDLVKPTAMRLTDVGRLGEGLVTMTYRTL